jgi:hypothetical protein
MVLWIASVAASAAEVSSPRHAVIAADNGKIVKYDPAGQPVWTYDIRGGVHHIQQLPDGHLLMQQGWGKIVEITPDRQIVWSYDSAASHPGQKVEVHTFQRLPGGNTMIVENGVGRIIEVDPQGKIVKEMKYRVSRPDAHRDVRQAHQLDNGHYLVCHEGDGRVTEYAPTGEVVWDYAVPLFGKERKGGHGPEAWGNQVFNALRLPGGNTLIATGNGHSVIEVTPNQEVVWQVQQQDLPGITLAWTTSLEVLPSGNILIGNCHAGPKNPQLIEVNRQKQAVWTFRDFELLGDSTAASATVGVSDGVLR